MTPAERAALRAHLLETGLAGDTRTSRASSVSNAEQLAAGDPDKHLGIGALGRDAEAIMRAVAALCGCSPSLAEREGPGVIDPDRTLAGLEALGERLARAAASGEAVLIATGHPSGLLPLYQSIARDLAEAGAVVVTPHADGNLDPPRVLRRPRWWRYFDGVGVLLASVDLVHTHESWPMDVVLDAALDAVEKPDLVLADHGFAGAAATRGLETICFTDINDPAIALAWEDGLIGVAVPLDDNCAPRAYNPIGEYLGRRIRAASAQA